MGFMIMARLAEPAVGLITANPVAIVDGLTGAAKSWATGKILDSEILAPIVEPVKDSLGEVFGDVDWADIAENSPFW